MQASSSKSHQGAVLVLILAAGLLHLRGSRQVHAQLTTAAGEPGQQCEHQEPLAALAEPRSAQPFCIEVRIVDQRGAPVAGADLLLARGDSPFRLAARTDAAGVASVRPDVAEGSGLLAVVELDGQPCGPLRRMTCNEGTTLHLSRALQTSEDRAPTGHLARELAQGASLVGQAVHALHGALCDVRIEAVPLAGSASVVVFTDSAGRFELNGLAPGPWLLRAHHPSLGRSLSSVRLEAQAEHTWSPVLQSGVQITGTLRDPAGLGLEDWLVIASEGTASEGTASEGIASEGIASTSTDKHGDFTLSGLAEGDYTLQLHSPGGASQPPLATRYEVRAGGPALALTLEPQEQPSATLEVSLAPGTLASELRLFRRGAEVGLWLEGADACGPFQAQDLRPGTYELTWFDELGRAQPPLLVKLEPGPTRLTLQALTPPRSTARGRSSTKSAKP